ENILNPERGFYTWIDILDDTDDYSWVREDGFTLAYAKVVLDGYQNSALDDPILNGLAAGFERVKNAGIKVILRFYYSDDPLNSDAPLSQILSHIAQLKPILQNSADVISTLQAGFIGRWGEWHTSTNGLDWTKPKHITEKQNRASHIITTVFWPATQITAPIHRAKSQSGRIILQPTPISFRWAARPAN
ncbi:MAG: DUF4874 domain-containing protein, partial [Deltaproteobacteria bacterium]|nr:DUF4874 domain-containing protein [Deltaproteobacteria bacterium]